MTLDEFIQSNLTFKYIAQFERAYRKGMERDPDNFLSERTETQWYWEYDLFIDVGGDADEPIE